ncbi:MAG: AMIN domain-containing protein [Desulforhopalus sp.]
MRWIALIVAVVAGIGLGIHDRAVADSAVPVSLESITFDSQSLTLENISFKLSSAVKPKIFTIPGDKPRLVVDFPETFYKGDTLMPLYNSNLALRIRTGLHSKPTVKTRVVVDLTTNKKVHHTYKYLEQQATLVVTLAQQPKKEIQAVEAKAPVQTEEKAAAVKQLPAEVVKTKPLAQVVPEKKTIEKSIEKPVEKATEKPIENTVLAAAVPKLLDISFDDSSNRGEMVLFHLNDFYPPTVSAIEKENPRVLCDFKNMSLAEGVRESIVASGKFVKHIRAEKYKNPDKIRIILDLSPERDYDLQQVFFKNDNLFVLIVNELPEKKVTE